MLESVEFFNQSTRNVNNHFVSFDWEFYDPTGVIDNPFGTSQQIPTVPNPLPTDLEISHKYVSNLDTILEDM